MRAATGRRRAFLLGALVLCAAVVLGILFLQGGGGPSAAQDTGAGQDTSTAAAHPGGQSTTQPTGVLPTATVTGEEPGAPHTPESGLPTIAESDLPAEARATMQLIYAGGPFSYRQDDETFFNREGILPDQRQGYYREYTVETPGSPDRGARRIVAGAEGDLYYTDDHYDSFRQIMEGR